MAQHSVSSIDPLAGVTAENNRATEHDLLPEDLLNEMGDHALSVEKRQITETDHSLPHQLEYMVAYQQRQKLDQQIESLYQRVVTELNDNPQDTAFALAKLQQSHDIVLENASPYDDALVGVAEVSKLLMLKYNIRYWSYTWGLAVFFYALVWLVVLIAGFFVDVSGIITATNGQQLWVVALAGGIGGVASIMYDLYWHVSIKNDFDRQYVIKYLVQPILGMVMGIVLFFIINAGLVWIIEPTQSTRATTYFAVLVLIGFVGGFRHQIIYATVDTLIKRLMPGKNKAVTQ